MKTFVAVCLLACAAAFPQDLAVLEGSGEPPVEINARSGLDDIYSADILRSNFDMTDDGQFQYGFETSDGTVVDAAGENRQIGDGAGVVMRGSYSYTSPEGVDVKVDWEADEQGFRAVGPQVPVAPEYVTRLLKTLPTEPLSAAPVSSFVPLNEDAPAPVNEVAAFDAPAAPVEEVAVPVVAAAPVNEAATFDAPAAPVEETAAPVVAAAPVIVIAAAPVADPAVPAIPDQSEFFVLDAASEVQNDFQPETENFIVAQIGEDTV